jgi:hypothetical protein
VGVSRQPYSPPAIEKTELIPEMLGTIVEVSRSSSGTFALIQINAGYPWPFVDTDVRIDVERWTEAEVAAVRVRARELREVFRGD